MKKKMSGLGLIAGAVIVYFVVKAIANNRLSARMGEMLDQRDSTSSVKGWAELNNELVSDTRIVSNVNSLVPFRTEAGQFGTRRQIAETDSGCGFTVPFAAGFHNQE